MTPPPVSRRTLLAAALACPLPLLWSRLARATPSQAQALIAGLRQGATLLSSSLIRLEAPELAENGNTVPFGITVDSPMTADDHLQRLHIISEVNPLPEIATIHVTPALGVAQVRTRIRLAATQTVLVVAVFSGQRVAVAGREVKVTIGGCGG